MVPRYLNALVVLGSLLVLTGSVVPVGADGSVVSECSVTLSTDQSIQAAIDDAGNGDTVCLETGTWQESVAISKSLTLRGLGDERSTVRSSGENDDTVSIRSPEPEHRMIELRNLELLGGESGIDVVGSSLTQSASLNVRNVRIANTGIGMRINGPDVTATVRDSVIEANDGLGIVADRAEALTVVDSVIAENHGTGLDLANGVQATIRSSTIRDTAAVSLPGQAMGQVGIGINVGADSRLELIDSVVRNNGAEEAQGSSSNGGIVVGAFAGAPFEPTPATADIQNSRIEANWLGVLIGQAADLHMAGTTVLGNRSWGLAGNAIPCGTTPAFTGMDQIMGDVQFDEGNVVEGNNVGGHLDGEGNPGKHPFENSADGQVCLPR